MEMPIVNRGDGSRGKKQLRRGGLRRFALSRPGLVILSLALTLLLLEFAFRAVAWYSGNFGRLDDLEREYAPLPEPGQPVPLGELPRFRLSANQRIVYEHRPGLRFIDESGNVFTINDAGFRGPGHAPPKEAGTVRIVGLGDSYMYGNGVTDDEVFLQRLSVKLNHKYGDRNWEVVNTAVGGYNTVMEVETLKEKGLRYEPDIVLILFVGNDLNLPNFIRDSVDFFAPGSFLFEFVARRLRQTRQAPLGATARLLPAPRSGDGNWYERDPDKVPVAYRGMVGLDAYRAAMRELKALSVRHGFELIVLQQNYRDFVTEICQELDLPLVHFQPALKEYMAQHGIDRYRGSTLSLGETDPHPSAEGHRIFAEVIFEFLQQSGAIERARYRTGR